MALIVGPPYGYLQRVCPGGRFYVDQPARIGSYHRVSLSYGSRCMVIGSLVESWLACGSY